MLQFFKKTGKINLLTFFIQFGMFNKREIGAKIKLPILIFLGRRKRDDASSHSIDDGLTNVDEILLEAEEFCVENVDYGEFLTFSLQLRCYLIVLQRNPLVFNFR